MSRIGIMGGMFDPVHVGHIQVALAVRKTLQLQEVRLIPCSIPNHRDQALCSPLQRLDMLKLATDKYAFLIVDDRELNRSGISYTYDTLASLRKQFPEAGLYFILGIDAFSGLPGWYRWRELFDLCHFVVIERPGYPVDLGPVWDEAWGRTVMQRRVFDPVKLFDQKNGLIFDMEGIQHTVSSSLVRERIARDETVTDLLDPAVVDYLEKHQLYRKAVINDKRES